MSGSASAYCCARGVEIESASPKTSELQFENAKGLLIARRVKQQRQLRRSFLPRSGANFDSVTASAPCPLDPPKFSLCAATPPARRSTPSPALAPPMPLSLIHISEPT